MQPSRLKAMIVFAAGLALSACATAQQTAGTPGAPSAAVATPAASTPASPGFGQRELTADEKKAITDAVAPNLKDPASARYHWAKFPAMTKEDAVNYCAIVDAKSPYAPYNGRQAYIVETKVLGGRVIGATMGLIAGGKDAVLVGKMCAKYNLDPKNAL